MTDGQVTHPIGALRPVSGHQPLLPNGVGDEVVRQLQFLVV